MESARTVVNAFLEKQLSEHGGRATGYADRLYAESLAEFGRPRLLPRSGAWILERQIPGFGVCDGMGCYPLFACEDWSGLEADLNEIGSELVSLSLVADPFGDYTLNYLKRCFDVVIPFKEHFVVDLELRVEQSVSVHHRSRARRSLRDLQIEVCPDPFLFVEDWQRLYDVLIRRHNIKGIQAFSKSAFATQLRVPGLVVFRAVHEGATVGMTLWYLQGGIAFYHLGAYNEAGYKYGASYALFWHAINHLADNGLRWVDLGASPGTKRDDDSGLGSFKGGWSSGTRTAYFCGRILDQEKYELIAREKGSPATDYFPVYRIGEFG